MLSNAFKTAVAILRRNVFFTAVSLFAISFTLLVLMTAGSLLDSLTNPLGPSQGKELASMEFAEMWGDNNHWNGNPGYRLLNECARDLPGVQQASFFSSDQKALTWHHGQKHELALKHTDAAFWQVFDFEFLEGGPFTDLELGLADQILVINRSTQELLFPEGALGKTLELGSLFFRIIGVVADVPRYDRSPYAEAWAPHTTIVHVGYDRRWMGNFNGVLHLDGTLPLIETRNELRRRTQEVDMSDQDGYENIIVYLDSSVLDRLSREIFSSGIAGEEKSHTSTLISLIILGVLLFMSLPALNLVNLNLSRMLERAPEIGVRRAFGATGGSLILQFLMENLVLVSIGALLAVLGHALVLSWIESSGLIAYADFRWNTRIFFMSLSLIVVFSVLSGILPAWRMARMHPVNALKGIS